MADERTARPFGGAVPRSVAWRQLATSPARGPWTASRCSRSSSARPAAGSAAAGLSCRGGRDGFRDARRLGRARGRLEV